MTGTVYQKWRRFARNGGVLGAGLWVRRGACVFGAQPARRGGLLRFAARAFFERFVLRAPPALLFVFRIFTACAAPLRLDAALCVFHAASVQRLKVPRSTWSLRAAPRAEISPFSQAAFTNSNSSGRSFGLLPKRTPRASAAAMPSAWRRRMKARSVSAT